MLDLARVYLETADEVLAALICSAGPCTLAPIDRENHFGALCRSITAQQVSTRAAQAIYGRFCSLYPTSVPMPADVLASPIDTLRGCGLSERKAHYVQYLAEQFHSGVLSHLDLDGLTDREVIEQLTQIKGIGCWTAQMFLIFALHRLDVLPVDDLGLKKAVRLHYGFDHLPTVDELQAVALVWQPYRSVATWYLWRSLDAG